MALKEIVDEVVTGFNKKTNHRPRKKGAITPKQSLLGTVSRGSDQNQPGFERKIIIDQRTID
jgi:hypothetical protein